MPRSQVNCCSKKAVLNPRMLFLAFYVPSFKNSFLFSTSSKLWFRRRFKNSVEDEFPLHIGKTAHKKYLDKNQLYNPIEIALLVVWDVLSVRTHSGNIQREKK